MSAQHQISNAHVSRHSRSRLIITAAAQDSRRSCRINGVIVQRKQECDIASRSTTGCAKSYLENANLHGLEPRSTCTALLGQGSFPAGFPSWRLNDAKDAASSTATLSNVSPVCVLTATMPQASAHASRFQLAMAAARLDLAQQYMHQVAMVAEGRCSFLPAQAAQERESYSVIYCL
eukprot:12243-Heterococcus_DN1.PRE.1